MQVGVPREIHPDERRVAATPRTVKRMRDLGFEVVIESGAGVAAGFEDAYFEEVGARMVTAEAVWGESDIVLTVRGPDVHDRLGVHEAELVRPGSVVIGFIWPAQNRADLERLAARKATVIAMDCIPRITRAQSVDALTAMANLAGYRAVIEAAHAYPRLLAGQTTAAGHIPPARVLVIGAGVAGLSAIGAARGLGAIVTAFDTRNEVADQVRSMGAEFLPLEFEEAGSGAGGYARKMSDAFIEAEMALFAQQAMVVDIIITTALIPGRNAPKLITAGMVETMREGSVIVDLAAQQGGNCTLTQPGEIVRHHGISIVGFTDLVSRMALQSSWLYSSTLVNLLEMMGGGKDFRVDMEDEVIRGAVVVHEGTITWPPPQPEPVRTPGQEPSASIEIAPSELGAGDETRRPARWLAPAVLAVVLLALWGLGTVAPPSFMSRLTVFVLACFVGWQVVWNVKPALHTPLMSVTNAISGIIIIGGLLQISGAPFAATTILGAAAVLLATINIVGGFLVTTRMLSMFSK